MTLTDSEDDKTHERNEMNEMMVYELWEHEGGHTLVGRDEDEAAYRHRLEVALAGESDARLALSIEAATHNEAMQLLYDHKHWGRYRTLEEELGDTEEAD